MTVVEIQHLAPQDTPQPSLSARRVETLSCVPALHHLSNNRYEGQERSSVEPSDGRCWLPPNSDPQRWSTENSPCPIQTSRELLFPMASHRFDYQRVESREVETE